MAGGEAGFHAKKHTRQSGLNDGKLGSQVQPHQPPICPQCESNRVWKDGLRYPRGGQGLGTQRWLCRTCGFRFSESSLNLHVKTDVISQNVESSKSPLKLIPDRASGVFTIEERSQDIPFKRAEYFRSHDKTKVGKDLNTFLDYNRNAEYSVSEVGAKNLAEVETRQEEAQREGTMQTETKGKIVEFLWELKKRGLKEASIEIYQHYLLQLIKRGANILDPESVKEVLAKQSWNENTKALAVASYSKFLGIQGGTWIPPKCKGVRKIPFIPLESELDQLISGAYTKMAAFLQLLKETGMRCGEALRLKWIEVDFKNGAITLNQPEKYGKPRMFKISSTLLAMLNTLPKQNDYIFGGQNPRNFGRIYRKYRSRMAFKLQNPRLKQISFHTFRHWKATMEYHRTKDILHVMEMLGHRDIKTTLIYTQLIHFESDEYHSAVAKTVDEARALIETGFEHVCNYEGVMLFRKRK